MSDKWDEWTLIYCFLSVTVCAAVAAVSYVVCRRRCCQKSDDEHLLEAGQEQNGMAGP